MNMARLFLLRKDNSVCLSYTHLNKFSFKKLTRNPALKTEMNFKRSPYRFSFTR